MINKKSEKKTIKKHNSKAKISKKAHLPTKDIKHAVVITPNDSEYKKGLLEVDKEEAKYDKLFEQKLADQYKEFRNLKEHHMQSKRFFRIVLVLITVILIALLLLSYRV